ncbi:MAG: superoxide dismutase [Ni] [Chlamydiia bacterium]
MRYLLTLGLLCSSLAWSHCQIPCGIYHDDLVLAQMGEQWQTMAKAIDQIIVLEKVCHNPQTFSQTTRWIINRDMQADHFAELVSTYFLQQRIPPGPDQAAIVATAHRLLVLAMQVKQQVNPQVAEDLHEALHQFESQYTAMRSRLDAEAATKSIPAAPTGTEHAH